LHTNCTTPHDPFSNWTALLNRPVYSSDRKKIGFLRQVLPEYIVVKKGLVGLSSYLIPKSLAESLDKKGIRLRITAFEARHRYSYSKMKRLALYGEVPKSAVRERIVYDRLQTVRYGTTRNRLAAGIAFVSGILFLLSGYRANIEIYNLIRDQLVVHTARDFWVYAVIPVGFLALLSQLGGFTVLMGAGLFAANRVNIGKFLVMIGTGQGLFTILLHILQEVWAGRWTLDNNYVTWLTSTAAGLGILFAIVASYITKGKGESLYVKIARVMLRRRKKG
jgi:hypothetical protein